MTDAARSTAPLPAPESVSLPDKGIDEAEAKLLLAKAGIAAAPEQVVQSADAAIFAAEGFGYPVVLMNLSQDSPARDRLQKIQTAARRAASLTQQMLAYAGPGRHDIEPLDLSDLVKEMAQLLESSVGRQALLETRLQPALPAIEGDSAQLSQVVMNLITDAAEAIG